MKSRLLRLQSLAPYYFFGKYLLHFMALQLFNRHQAVVMSIMTLPQGESKDWLVVIRLKVKDGTAVVDDLRKAGLQVSYAG